MKGGFQWHPLARVFDLAGEVGPLGAGSVAAVIAERPAGVAVAVAVALAIGAFRIGGEGPAPVGAFETLTGGSTGKPRRIRRSAASWIASFGVNSRIYGIGPGVVAAVPGRLTQSLALYGALEAVHLGAEVHLLDGMRVDRQAQALRDRGVEVLYVSPTQMRGLVEAGVGWPGLRHVVIGGAKLDAGLRRAVAERAPGAVVHEFYGAAEASFISISEEDSPEASVGRPYPGVEIRVDAAEGEVGEIWVRSPYLFEGYAGEDQGGARWRDGFLSVGEMGALRGGYLYLAGRAGRMVTVADQNVFPEEMEVFLLGLEGVRRAAVVPVTDARRGVHLVAVLQGEALVDVLAALRARWGTLRAPKRVVWRGGDWPELPSGKTDLRLLAEWVAG